MFQILPALLLLLLQSQSQAIALAKLGSSPSYRSGSGGPNEPHLRLKRLDRHALLVQLITSAASHTSAADPPVFPANEKFSISRESAASQPAGNRHSEPVLPRESLLALSSSQKLRDGPAEFFRFS
jgi:hypothetical protein